MRRRAGDTYIRNMILGRHRQPRFFGKRTSFVDVSGPWRPPIVFQAHYVFHCVRHGGYSLLRRNFPVRLVPRYVYLAYKLVEKSAKYLNYFVWVFSCPSQFLYQRTSHFFFTRIRRVLRLLRFTLRLHLAFTWSLLTVRPLHLNKPTF